ncbi:hypothetical protein SLA2020_382430 [Shorea laevis]
MASNPPFQVEDQTDEDFFDKLVDDEFGPTATTGSNAQLADGSDSDDAKAFANLSIGEVGNAFDDLGAEGKRTVWMVAQSLWALTRRRGIRWFRPIRLDVIAYWSPVLMEVGWNSFHADSDSAHNGNKGFGSYSDFFSELGGGSGDFPGNVGDNLNKEATIVSAKGESVADGMNNSVNHVNYQEGQVYGASLEQSTNGQDLSSSQYWENLYPGWKYDPNTGQMVSSGWFVMRRPVADVHDSASDWGAVSDRKTEVSYMQQAAQSVVGTVTETSTTESVYSQGNNGYPDHMVFDSQYPGWYYDTIAQEWRTLDSYTSSIQSTALTHDQQQHQNGFVSPGFGSQGQDGRWAGANSNNHQQDLITWPTETVPKSEAFTTLGGNQQWDNSYSSKASVNIDQQESFNSFGAIYNGGSHQSHGKANGTFEFKNFVPDGNFSQQFNQPNPKPNEQTKFSNDYFGSKKSVGISQHSFENGHQTSYAPNVGRSSGFSQQSFENGHQTSYASNVGRSSAGRPPHALVTFGFGGKLIVMKDTSPLSSSSYGSQDPVGGSISVLNLMEVVMGNTDPSSLGLGASGYFHALCKQSFPGPLVGGSVASKELNKWIDERITGCESPDMDYRRGEVLRLLLSLLKIACQHYGKLRSPFGADTISRENDSPESAVAKLFASAKRNGAQFGEYGALSHCLQKLPSEGQIKATASEVQNLLVFGRKREALQFAQEGQLWGPALVLASQLGDQFYVDTVKQMALQQLVAGSPLRTLCLLIAGQPAEVFLHTPQLILVFRRCQSASTACTDWGQLTKDDELVIIHLGDCLWKERSEITAAHICYLVAEANFESYSDSARLCLIGADHWKFPRTYASPEAIQRTELYEYSKVLGNSQFVLQPFQPYKLIYAHMLAEVGKVSDSLKYCQAVLKSLKTGRAPEVETWKQLVLSLEERIKTHQQGGYTANLAPAKLVGKLLNFLIVLHIVLWGVYHLLLHQHHKEVSQPISDWTADGNRMKMANRSVSEPDFGRTPRQDQLLQKTVGLVLRPRSGKQAKLGEKNKFYYDEKLKRWVEEGVEPPAEEAALPPPPPTTAAFQNGMPDYNLKSTLQKERIPTNQSLDYRSPTPSEHTSGIPSIPSSSNQFSARGRMGVRSRYVDTFNQGGGSPANLFQSPSVPSVKPSVAANAKFFIPTPASSVEETVEAIAENGQEETTSNEDPRHPSEITHSSRLYPSSSMTIQRFPSMVASQPREGGIGHAPIFVMPNEPSLTRMPMSSGSFGDDLHEVEL